MIVYPALEYAYDESYIRTPAMEISNTWRAAAVFVGAVLLGLSAALRFVLLPVSGRLVLTVVAAACSLRARCISRGRCSCRSATTIC